MLFPEIPLTNIAFPAPQYMFRIIFTKDQMDREYKFHRKTDLDLKPTKTVLTNKNTP